MNRADTTPHKVISITHLTKTVFVLRFERKGLSFKTGQHINVGPGNNEYTREYSVYSGENDDYLEILIKEVQDGFISPLLKKTKPGDYVMVESPLGYFTMPDDSLLSEKYLLIATGTGIAPFRSFVRTYPKLDYLILHGVRDHGESLHHNAYDSGKYLLCTSRQKDGDYYGRVTQWIRENTVSSFTNIYLCGNRNMINEAMDLLIQKGTDRARIQVEAYF